MLNCFDDLVRDLDFENVRNSCSSFLLRFSPFSCKTNVCLSVCCFIKDNAENAYIILGMFYSVLINTVPILTTGSICPFVAFVKVNICMPKICTLGFLHVIIQSFQQRRQDTGSVCVRIIHRIIREELAMKKVCAKRIYIPLPGILNTCLPCLNRKGPND